MYGALIVSSVNSVRESQLDAGRQPSFTVFAFKARNSVESLVSYWKTTLLKEGWGPQNFLFRTNVQLLLAVQLLKCYAPSTTAYTRFVAILAAQLTNFNS